MTEPGELLGENYRVREVRNGGMGQIFICDWERRADGTESSAGASAPIALKTFQRRFFFDNSARLSFVREASTWLRLSDVPHVMPVIAIETIGDRPFIVMPAVPPGVLGERSIADLVQLGPIDADAALAFAFQIALALNRASDRISGLVHGDLKPANVLLFGGDAFLSDFGLVSAVSMGRPDLRLQGTWAYRAPELWGDEPAAQTVASDVYAFGALLFEMLTGRSPFNPAADRPESWAAAHRESSPDVPDGHPATALWEASMGLALTCLAKDAGARPPGFADVLGRIRAIFEEFHPVEELMLLWRVHELQNAMLEQAPEARRVRVNSLLSLDEAQQALQELETIPPEEYDANLWVTSGTALNLANRPEEALESLERGLAQDLSPAARVNAESEYALALKRLNRMDEARQIYEELMTEVPDDQLHLVVVNLATVYLIQERPEEALQLLESFVRKTPQVPEAWANLGESYAMVGRYADAVAAFGKALVAAPQDGRTRVRMAAVYMDHLGELEQAWAALDTAFDVGYESREWFVRMLASSLLLERQDTVRGLLLGAKNNMPKDFAQSLLEESIEMARNLAEKYAGEQGAGEGVPSEPATQSDVVSRGGDEAGADARPDELTEVEGSQGEPGIPFLNFRYYDFGDFTIDYYQRPDVEDFVPMLLTELRRAKRNPHIAVGGATLRGSPFYFTMCPGCGITVLTNRDVGKPLRCRMCETTWETTVIRGPLFDGIVADVSAELGIEQGDDTGRAVYVLFVQPADAAALDAVTDVCREAGMAELGTNRILSVYMLQDATTRGLAKHGRPWSVWMMTSSEREAWARDSTPRAISRVVRELQERAPGVTTLSMTLTADEMASMDETLEQVDEQAERQLRAAIRSGEAQARDLRLLASMLDFRGEHRKAERMARAAVAADENSAEGWEILGRALLRQDDFAGARDALEESLARDPTSVLGLMMLSHCYEQLGDSRRAADLHARAISHSGGAFG